MSLDSKDTMNLDLEKAAGSTPSRGHGDFSSAYEHQVNEYLRQFSHEAHHHDAPKHPDAPVKIHRGLGWWLLRVVLPILAGIMLCSLIPVSVVAVSQRNEPVDQTQAVQTRSDDLFPFDPAHATSRPISAHMAIDLTTTFPQEMVVTAFVTVTDTEPFRPISLPTGQPECSLVESAISPLQTIAICACDNGELFDLESVDGFEGAGCAVPSKPSTTAVVPTASSTAVAETVTAPTGVESSTAPMTTLLPTQGFCGVKGESCG